MPSPSPSPSRRPLEGAADAPALPAHRRAGQLPANDRRSLYRQLLSYGGYRQGGARRLPPTQLTALWLRQHGTLRPVVVPTSPGAPAALGLGLPAQGLTARGLAATLGLGTEVWAAVQGVGRPPWPLM